MPKKKQKSTPAVEKDAPPCHIEGCGEAGLYKAPISRTNLREYAWYCLDHVREYNQKWDYFSGMSRTEIEKFMRDALTGHRPTWSREGRPQYYTYEDLQEALDDFLNPSHTTRKPKHARFKLDAKTQEALAVMDMDYPYTEKDLKQCYRALVKQFHPDINRGNHQAEERFKRITVAYLFLTEHLKNNALF